MLTHLKHLHKSRQMCILTSSKIEPTLAVTNNTGVLCPAIILNDTSNSGSTYHNTLGYFFSELLYFSIQFHTHSEQRSPTQHYITSSHIRH